MNKFYKDVHEMQLDAIKDWWLLSDHQIAQYQCDFISVSKSNAS